MENIEWLNKRIYRSSTTSIRQLHKLIFGNDGDRKNRARLRKFNGFELDVMSEEYKNIVTKVIENYSVTDLQPVCRLLRINDKGQIEDVAERLCAALNNLETLSDFQESDDEESDYEVAEEDLPTTNKANDDSPVSKEDLILKMLEVNEALVKNLSLSRPREFQIMPDFKNNIHCFNGKEARHEAEAWLETLNGVAKLHSWPEEFKLEAVRAHLVGPARNWFLGKSFHNWNDFESKFKRTYVGSEDLSSQWQEMLQRAQGKNEDTEDYLQDKLRMCRKLKLNFDTMKLQVIEGLWSRDLSDHLLGIKHLDEDELRDSITTYERVNKARALRIKKSFTSPVTSTESTNLSTPCDEPLNATNARKPVNLSTTYELNSHRVPKCYSCGKQGHIAKNCSERGNITCRKCGQEGHFGNSCMSEGNVSIIRHGRNNLSNLSKYIKLVKVNGKSTVPGLIDTGASDCTILESTVKRLGLRRIPMDVTLTGFGDGGRSTHVKEASCCMLSIEGVLGTEINMLIVPDGAQLCEIIVGRSWLDQPHVAYYSVGGNLKMGYREESPFKDPPEIYQEETPAAVIRTDHSIELPPNSMCTIIVEEGNKIINASIENKQSNICNIKQGTRFGYGYLRETDCEKKEIGSILVEREVNTASDASEDQRRQLLDPINEFKMCFARCTPEIGVTNVSEMEIIAEPDSKPVNLKPYQTRQNERVNRTVLPVIPSALETEDGSDWDKELKLCKQALNLCVNQSTDKSPYELLYGHQPKFDVLGMEVKELIYSANYGHVSDMNLGNPQADQGKIEDNFD